MLNTAPILSQPTRAGLPSAGDNNATDAATPPFAQALDKASAQQRGARDEAGPDAGSTSAPEAQAEPPANGTAPLSAAARAAAARKAAAQAAVAGTALPADKVAQRPQDGISPVTTGQADEAMPLADEAPPFDLSAWVPGLPLPPAALRQAPAVEQTPAPRAAVAGTLASAGRGGPGVVGLALPESDKAASTEAVEVQAQQGVLPKGEGKRALPSAIDDLRVAGASPQSAEKDSRLAAQALAQGMAQGLTTARQSLSIDASRDGIPAASTPLASLSVAMLQAAPALTSSAAPFQAELAVPLGTQEFAPALGSQLSVLVRDGIEHARLKLNPAEMGPIDVRISVDGQQAQVDFSAAHAGTRQILQDAVPALASALRESGLTLTGGGVFDQPREQRGDMQRGASPQRGAAFEEANESLPSNAQVSRPTPARGVVDLYA